MKIIPFHNGRILSKRRLNIKLSGITKSPLLIPPFIKGGRETPLFLKEVAESGGFVLKNPPKSSFLKSPFRKGGRVVLPPFLKGARGI